MSTRPPYESGHIWTRGKSPAHEFMPTGNIGIWHCWIRSAKEQNTQFELRLRRFVLRNLIIKSPYFTS